MRILKRTVVLATLVALLTAGTSACSPQAARYMAGAVIFTAAAASMAKKEMEIRQHHHHYHYHYEPHGIVPHEHDHRLGPLRYVDPETGQIYIYEEDY